MDITVESLVALYTTDMQSRVKENTWGTKEHIIRTKLFPYFGKPYSPVYLKTLHHQLSAIFNHTVKYYNLKTNPAAKVGNMDKVKGREMLWPFPPAVRRVISLGGVQGALFKGRPCWGSRP